MKTYDSASEAFTVTLDQGPEEEFEKKRMKWDKGLPPSAGRVHPTCK